MIKLSDPFDKSSLGHVCGNHMKKHFKFECETNNDQVNPIVRTYPWILDFKKLCLSELLNESMESLIKLTKFYIKNVAKAVKDCYGRPKRAAKLKLEMSNTLTFFHYVYREVKMPLEYSSYLENMSDLMAMYIDMEINASRNGIESIRKVASMITSSLKLYFDNFLSYILDTILKTNIITKRHRDLGDLIFRWVLRDFPESTIDIITYVRYILVFKMWKEIMQESKERQRQIVELACIKLQPPIGLKERLESNQTLRGLFPIIPRSDITKFLMKAKFSSRKKAEVFFKALADPLAMGFLTYPISSLNDTETFSAEQGRNPVDKILNEIWFDLNNSKLGSEKDDLNNLIKEKKSEDLNTSEFCGKSDLEYDMCCKLKTKKEEINHIMKESKSVKDCSPEKSDHEEHVVLPGKKRRSCNSELKEEEKKIIFKTPAQLKAFNDPLNIALDSVQLPTVCKGVTLSENLMPAVKRKSVEDC